MLYSPGYYNRFGGLALKKKGLQFYRAYKKTEYLLSWAKYIIPNTFWSI